MTIDQSFQQLQQMRPDLSLVAVVARLIEIAYQGAEELNNFT
jgi:hypothetical protein